MTDNISERLARGMELAVEKCLIDKVVKGQSVVYAHDDGSVYTMSAKDALDHFLAEAVREARK
ncbi:hypothetical protein [uncultured Duncaniella sp.]|uniref:hypothetical protein n=1 Tax=uncultured Duncaniella sp. TaxID=2768039 RepID=UPI0025A9D6BB|nr:hypothetical protein [uncultured Duncaniella sp.]